MADMHYARPEPGPERAKLIVRLTNLTGAALSLALIAGVGVWGTKMVLRDVSGVPVVRAAEGPMREAPADPGGDAAANQGLSVNAVAAEGTAAAPADRLVLAPPPLELSLEDVAPLTPTAEVAEATPRAEVTEPAPQAVPEEVQNASILALADQIAAGAAPIAPLEEEVTGPEAVETPDVEDVAVAQAVVRPRARPASLTSVSEAVALAVAAARSAPSDEVDAETIPLGTRLAQLGAFDSAEVARAEWDRLAGRFGDFLDGKQRVIQRAESGGRTFYRLRAMGFADLGDARRFCSALVAERAECIPVVTR
ncbi:SPOR domain-containing protein [Roseovarius mucosus]|uniref:Sporulation related domain protein n=1 Tax=Roseovarius mucosus TaxID=215743 RepID=A0A1V0RJ76_9RHOB|nr:SPOR domain-containing protein [Roseovarius mucosus]ARE81814.1 sporulation related domain protein [Roseovarius mucosus]|tara:strand:- start:6909 stop:7838 length:930 start_codon:yes stop_codon:yes gene_type:complete